MNILSNVFKSGICTSLIQDNAPQTDHGVVSKYIQSTGETGKDDEQTQGQSYCPDSRLITRRFTKSKTAWHFSASAPPRTLEYNQRGTSQQGLRHNQYSQDQDHGKIILPEQISLQPTGVQAGQQAALKFALGPVEMEASETDTSKMNTPPSKNHPETWQGSTSLVMMASSTQFDDGPLNVGEETTPTSRTYELARIDSSPAQNLHSCHLSNLQIRIDKSTWTVSQLPSGTYNFQLSSSNNIPEKTRTVRWVIKQWKKAAAHSHNSPVPSSSRAEQYNFSILNPNARRHAVIAHLSSTGIETLNRISPLAGNESSEAQMDMDKDTQILILITGALVALREGLRPVATESQGPPVEHLVRKPAISQDFGALSTSKKNSWASKKCASQVCSSAAPQSHWHRPGSQFPPYAFPSPTRPRGLRFHSYESHTLSPVMSSDEASESDGSKKTNKTSKAIHRQNEKLHHMRHRSAPTFPSDTGTKALSARDQQTTLGQRTRSTTTNSSSTSTSTSSHLSDDSSPATSPSMLGCEHTLPSTG